jgi:hypothetical protein
VSAFASPNPPQIHEIAVGAFEAGDRVCAEPGWKKVENRQVSCRRHHMVVADAAIESVYGVR